MIRLEELLEKEGVIVYKTQGFSMKPMLKENRDVVVIKPAKERLKPMDVAFYKRGESYILHRVLEVKEDYYLIRGDNTFIFEEVPFDDVLGLPDGNHLFPGKRYGHGDPGQRPESCRRGTDGFLPGGRVLQ